MKDRYFSGLCVLIGLLTAALKIVFTFLPMFYAMDVLWFGALGLFVAYQRPRRPVRWILLSILPTLLLIALALKTADLSDLRRGVGIGWVYSLVLIVISVSLGGWLGSRYRLRRMNA